MPISAVPAFVASNLLIIYDSTVIKSDYGGVFIIWHENTIG